MIRRFISGTEAAVLLYVTISIPVIFGMAALAVDAGYLYYLKSRAQTAADAAAVSAVQNVGSDPTGAAQVFAEDEFAAGTFSLTVQTGSWERDSYGVSGFDEGFSSPYDAARAEISFTGDNAVQLFFANTFGFAEGSVLADAVALTVGGIPESCLITLNPSDDKTLFVNGDVDLDLIDCGVYVNSDHPSAAAKAAGKNLDVDMIDGCFDFTDPDAPVEIVFNSDGSCNGTVVKIPNSFIVAGTCDGCEALNSSGEPVIDPFDPDEDQGSGNQIPDPYATFNSVTDLLSGSYSYDNGGGAVGADPWSTSGAGYLQGPAGDDTDDGRITITGDTTLYPGIYRDITANNSTSGTVTWMPGVYVICPDGGSDKGINFANLNHTSDANNNGILDPEEGVTFVLTCDAEFKMSGNGSINLHAPSTDTDDAGYSSTHTPSQNASELFGGFLVYEDADPTRHTSSSIDITGTSGVDISGAIYTPKSKVKIAGTVGSGSTPSGDDCFMVIAESVEFFGTSDISMSSTGCAGLFGGTPLDAEKQYVLVE